MFSNEAILLVDLLLQFLTLKISHAKFPVKLSTDEYATNYNEQLFDGLITISQIVRI